MANDNEMSFTRVHEMCVVIQCMTLLELVALKPTRTDVLKPKWITPTFSVLV